MITYTNYISDLNSTGDGSLENRELTETGKWINLIHNKYLHFIYNSKLQVFNTKYKKYENNIETELLDDSWEPVKLDQDYFIRLDSCSARDADEIRIRYISDINHAIMTSLRAQLFMMKRKNPINNIYLIPFNEYIVNNNRYEFRVTVYLGKITTIMPYYKKYKYDLEEIKVLTEKAIIMINDFINKYKITNTYVVDIFLMPNHETIIELNTFGKTGVCGLPYFNWFNDDQIYNTNGDIEVRFKQK